MKTIVIKPLTSELTADYLDFFDNRAFTDDNPNGPCYCTSPNQDEKQIENMVSEFKSYGVKETLRKYAVEMLDRVCQDAKEDGYICVEAYPMKSEGMNSLAFTGPKRLYEKTGFVIAAQRNGMYIMRKQLNMKEALKMDKKMKQSKMKQSVRGQ